LDNAPFDPRTSSYDCAGRINRNIDVYGVCRDHSRDDFLAEGRPICYDAPFNSAAVAELDQIDESLLDEGFASGELDQIPADIFPQTQQRLLPLIDGQFGIVRALPGIAILTGKIAAMIHTGANRLRAGEIRALERIAQKVGFSVLRRDYVGRALTLDRLLWNVGRLARGKAIQAALESISRSLRLTQVRLKINIRDMQRVYLKKPQCTAL
jgi:hypothetical protein